MAHTRLGANGHLSEWVANQFDPQYRGYAIDVGASDGTSVNSSWVLEKHHGWTVVCVEANPYYYPLLNECRPWVEKCAVSSKNEDEVDFYVNVDNQEAFSALRPSRESNGTEFCKIKVPVRTLDEIIEKWRFPRLDALFVDVEGGEMDVLKGFSIPSWRPKTIVTESWNETSPIDEYLSGFGYRKTARSVHNDLFVRID